jgi:arylsulfatase A-like enzyme
MRSLVDAVCGCFLVMAALAAPGAALAAAEDGSDLPKLVVLVVVDGLPQDQVVKYLDQLGEGGFKRLLDRGAWFTNAHYGHSMTETAVGHATIATGAHPYRHGVVGNDWFDRKTKKQIYGVSDPSSLYLGEPTPDSKVGTSPRNLRVLTIGDELRLKTGFRGRVLSISIKDRGAILSGGKLGAAYWLSPATGRFITSTYYRTSNYPDWWQRFHAGAPQDAWFGQKWEPVCPSAAYARSAPGDRYYHTNYRALGTGFPHSVTGGIAKPGKEYYEALARTPFGDEYLLAFTKAAVRGENLGKNANGVPDLLVVSFSSHDYVNHLFGPESMQSHDHFLRLDHTIADLLDFVDEWVGLAKTLVVLTADHGFSNAPEYCIEDLKLDAGRIDPKQMVEELNAHLSAKFGAAQYTLYWLRPTVYLDYEVIDSKRLNRADVETAAAHFLASYRGVFSVYTRTQLTSAQGAPTRFWQMVARTWNAEISGDLLVVPKNCWYLAGPPKEVAAMHGSPWTNDSHVPLIFMGRRWIQPGKYASSAEIVDIVPTLAHVTNVRPPDGSEGRVLAEILRDGDQWPAEGEPEHARLETIAYRDGRPHARCSAD